MAKTLSGDLGGLKFELDNARKDVRYYTHLAENFAVPSVVGEAVHQSLRSRARFGYGRKFVPSLVEAAGADHRRPYRRALISRNPARLANFLRQEYCASAAVNAFCTPSAISRRTPMIRLNGQQQDHEVDADPNTPLLWAIREQNRADRHQVGCGIAQCGACTVHIDWHRHAIVRAAGSAPSSAKKDHHHPRAWLSAPHCTRCKRPGSNTTCRNAATASRNDHGGGRVAEESPSPPTPISMRRSPYLPLRDLSSRCAKAIHSAARRKEAMMKSSPRITAGQLPSSRPARESAVSRTRLRIPFECQTPAQAATTANRVNAWVRDQSRTTPWVIRVARSEMGRARL